MNKRRLWHRDRLQDLPEWLEEVTENLVEPRSTSSGCDSRDPQEPPRADTLPARAPMGKHSLFTHFRKRNSQRHKHRATKFGETITADHKVLHDRESWNHQRYVIVVEDLVTQRIHSYICKTITSQEAA